MRFLTTIMILALLALSSCRHGRTGQQGEPGINGYGQDGQDGRDGQDGTDSDRIVVVRGIDGVYLPSYVTVTSTLPDDLAGLGAIVDDEGLLILSSSGIYAVRTRGDALVVLRSAEEGDIPGGEIQNSPGRLAVGDTVIFGGLGPKDED